MATTPARLAAVAVMASVVASTAACQAPPPEPASPSPTVTAAAAATPTVVPPSPAATASPVATGEPSLEPTRAPSPTPAPSPTSVSPSPAATPRADIWRYLADFPAGEAIDVSAVGHDGEKFIAVGSEPAEGQPIFGLRQGVIWTSDDGSQWQRTDDEAFANATLLHVAVAGDTTYVLGVRSICLLVEDDCLDLPDAGMTVWRDTGEGWEVLPQSESMRDAFVAGVVVLDGMLVGYGDRSSAGGDSLIAAVWVSDDGAEWQEVTDLAGLDPVSAAGVGPDGLVAFGTRLIRGTDRIETVAAFSEDGRTFEPAVVPTGMEAVIESVTFGEAGFVAVGATEDAFFRGRKPTVLVSADGRIWTETRLDDSFAGTGLHQVRPIPGGYLLIGYRPSGADLERDVARTWVSEDGSSWHRPALLAGGAYRLYTGSAVGPDGVIVFVLDYEEEVLEGPLSTIRGWFAPLDDLGP